MEKLINEMTMDALNVEYAKYDAKIKKLDTLLKEMKASDDIDAVKILWRERFNLLNEFNGFKNAVEILGL